MSTLREAAEIALDALNNLKTREPVDKEIAVLRAALASQTVPSNYLDSQQPVAWMDGEGDLYKMPEIDGWAPPHTMLYTAPPQRTPLTDEEIEQCMKQAYATVQRRQLEHAFARAIERAHGIGGEK